jgi:hypothetical protein
MVLTAIQYMSDRNVTGPEEGTKINVIHYMYQRYDRSIDGSRAPSTTTTALLSPCCPPACGGLAIAAPMACVRNASPRGFLFDDGLVD